jgi:hypothetical protein
VREARTTTATSRDDHAFLLGLSRDKGADFVLEFNRHVDALGGAGRRCGVRLDTRCNRVVSTLTRLVVNRTRVVGLPVVAAVRAAAGLVVIAHESLLHLAIEDASPAALEAAIGLLNKPSPRRGEMMEAAGKTSSVTAKVGLPTVARK